MTPEQIAKGLSPSRRKALLGDTRLAQFSTATCDELVDKGLIDISSRRLTDLGLAVRAILEDARNAE